MAGCAPFPGHGILPEQCPADILAGPGYGASQCLCHMTQALSYCPIFRNSVLTSPSLLGMLVVELHHLTLTLALTLALTSASPTVSSKLIQCMLLSSTMSI